MQHELRTRAVAKKGRNRYRGAPVLRAKWFFLPAFVIAADVLLPFYMRIFIAASDAQNEISEVFETENEPNRIAVIEVEGMTCKGALCPSTKHGEKSKKSFPLKRVCKQKG